MSTILKLYLDKDGVEVNQNMHKEKIIGSLLYLTSSSPDIVSVQGCVQSFKKH